MPAALGAEVIALAFESAAVAEAVGSISIAGTTLATAVGSTIITSSRAPLRLEPHREGTARDRRQRDPAPRGGLRRL